jgi:hypothetical protein
MPHITFTFVYTFLCLFSTDILNLTLSHDPSLLRGFTAHQRPDYPLLRCLVERFTRDPQIGVKSQCAEILKILLDTDAVGEEVGKIKRR